MSTENQPPQSQSIPLQIKYEDLTARYAVRRRTAVMLNVANLFDNEHYEIFGGDMLRRRALVTVVQGW